MLLGLLPWFRRSGSAAAITSWAVGVTTFFYVKFVLNDVSTATQVAAPVLSSLVLFTVMGWMRRSPVDPQVDALLHALNSDQGTPEKSRWTQESPVSPER
jgi:SSS family solute:Na+ symporter